MNHRQRLIAHNARLSAEAARLAAEISELVAERGKLVDQIVADHEQQKLRSNPLILRVVE